jgi:hypothetical protein
MPRSSDSFPAPPFDAVLEDVRKAAGDPHETEEALANPFAAVVLPLADDAARGGMSQWTEASDWIDVAEPGGNSRAPLVEETSRDAIAKELKLESARSREELNYVRRAFMSRNHPDRYEGPQQIIAARRAALANMLIDEACARLERRSPTEPA